MEENKAKMEPSEKEKKLIELVRNTGCGEIRITVRNGRPVLVEEVKRSVKL